MHRHAFSHGAATFLTAIAAGLITRSLDGLLPWFTALLENFSIGLIWALRLPSMFTVEVVSTLLLASLLAMVWGVGFGVLTGSGRARNYW